MSKYNDLVRYRNDGEDFHILWTARRTLRLLDQNSGLTAVAIEGASPRESNNGKKIEEGLLVIDTAEYYGAETLKDAKQVVYCQLKYSTTSPEKPWNVAGLKSTLKGFAKRFKMLCSKYDLALLSSKIRFRFVTNRPIAEALNIAFKAAKTTPPPKIDARAQTALAKLRKITGLSATRFKEFVSLIDLLGGEESRANLSEKLEEDTSRFLTVMDQDASLRMKSMVHSRTLSDASKNNTINRSAVLHCLKVVEGDLSPAPPRFESAIHQIPHRLENSIVEAIIKADHPIVIHAPGGVGKSVLAQRLPKLLPDGSEAVLFDGFAGGSYRDPSDRRHLHRRGLVHIVNTLAYRGLCDVLIPIQNASDDAFLHAFQRRLVQAALVVQARSQNAVLVVILDAADNSVIAAQERQESSFTPDILRIPLPTNCRIVALARSENRNLLKLPIDTVLIRLNAFSIQESRDHLLHKFKMASKADIQMFHKFTDGNPRVQANALAEAKTLNELLSNLGPRIRTVKTIIKDQLERALEKIKEEQGVSYSDIKSLCIALAALPPPVPIDTLATAANMTEDSIASFASDFLGGRPLLIDNGSIQFRDEPVETWFQQKFVASPKHYDQIINLLNPKATTDSYIASALPYLLLQAQRYSKLIDLALCGEPLKFSDPVKQREVLLRRVQFALKAAIIKQRIGDACKLMIRAGEEVAADERQSNFLISNADLASKLSGPQTLFDFVFRRRAWTLSETGYSHCAAMLANDPNNHAEARHFLDLSKLWLNEWASTPQDKRMNIGFSVISEFFLAFFYLDGAAAAVNFLNRWQPETLSFDVSLTIADRFIGYGQFDDLIKLMVAARDNLHIRMAVTLAFNRISKTPDSQDVKTTVGLLLGAKGKDLYKEHRESSIPLAIVTVAEAAVKCGLPKSDIKKLLDKYQVVEDRILDHWDSKNRRDVLMRYAALKAALDDRELDLDDVTPASLRESLTKPEAEHNSDVRRFREIYGALIPWYRLRVRAIIKGIKPTEWECLLSLINKESNMGDSWLGGDHERHAIINQISLLWFDLLAWARLTNLTRVRQMEKWLDRQKMIFTPTWTSLAARASHIPKLHGVALNFVNQAKKLIEEEHADARSMADSLAALARATLLVSKDDARSYFECAIEHLNRLGHDEFYDRLYSFFMLAIYAGKTSKPEPQEAYRLARVIEVFHSHNDHKFPWDEASNAVASLCPVSGLALASRWEDRDKVGIRYTLPSVVNNLLKKGYMAPAVAGSLHAFHGYWGHDNWVDPFISGNSSAQNRQMILDFLVQDEEFENKRDHSVMELLKAAKSHQLQYQRLRELASFISSKPPESPPNSILTDTVPTLVKKVRKEPSWATILLNCDLGSTIGIEKVMGRLRSGEFPINWEQIHTRFRKLIPTSAWVSHVRALTETSSLEAWQKLHALEAISKDWENSEGVRKALQNSIKSIIKEHPFHLARGRWVSRPDIERCAKLSCMTEKKITQLLIESMSDHVEHIAAGPLFYLAGEMARVCLTPAESLDALKFALNRLEPILKDTDGDGPWKKELEPPCKLSEATAQFLFAMLAAPAAETRWRSAHAVRRLCKLGQKNEISFLIDLLNVEKLPAFTDSRLRFYYWNGRMYLLIALARSALESPAELYKHRHKFIRLAFTSSHVLIRHFAAAAALAIGQKYPDALSNDDERKLQAINVSPFQPELPKKGTKLGWDMQYRRSTRRFLFDYDFERYWLGPLARAFNITQVDVEKRAQNWILKKWNEKTRGYWKEDRRAQMGMYTSHGGDHGSYPHIDNLSFYLDYHAMMCTAGELLSEKPTAVEKDWGEHLSYRWPEWLKDHLLTRPDGKWLSDRRDFEPLERPRWQAGPTRGYEKTSDWRWAVQPIDFDQALGFKGGQIQKLVIWGRWERSQKNQKERIEVATALVSPKTSLALLRALQTINRFHDYRIPPEGEDHEIFEDPFELRGWVSDPHAEFGFDKFDPFVGQINWPGPRPGRLLRRLWRLRCDEEQRVWKHKQTPVIWTTIWGSPEKDPYAETKSNGARMCIDFDFVKKALKRLNRNLIIEVEINRDDGTKKEETEYAYQNYTRLYVLKADGSFHTLRGCRGLRPETTRGN